MATRIGPARTSRRRNGARSLGSCSSERSPQPAWLERERAAHVGAGESRNDYATEGRGSEAEERCTVAKPGQSPATPTLAKLRRVLGDLISGYGNKRTHMIQIYATNLHSTLDAALWLRNVATDAERKELDSIEARARVLLLHAANPDSNKINR